MLSKEQEDAAKQTFIQSCNNDPKIQQDIERLNKDPFLAKIRAIAALDTMEAQFNQQIQDLIDLPIEIKSAYGLETAWLVKQGKSITDLAHQFQREFEQFKVPQVGQQQSTYDLFNTIMDGEKYDTEICYRETRLFDGTYQFSWNSFLSERCGLKQYKWKKPIQKLQIFFESNHSMEEKKQIEIFIIFALILQATWDIYQTLRWESITGLGLDFDEKSNSAVCAIGHVMQYLALLDNMTYKYHSTAYKLFSSVMEFGFWFMVSTVFGLPLPIAILVLGGTGSLVPVALGITIIFWLSLLLIPFCLQMYSFHCDPKLRDRWGANWAYRLPDFAVDDRDYGRPASPADIGIFPVFKFLGLGRKEVAPVGTSFKLMSQFGFFPLKETTTAAVEMAEQVLISTTGKNTVYRQSFNIFGW